MDQILKEEIIEKAKEYDVKFIRLQFTDIFGTFKNVAITIDELQKALDGKLYFDSSIVHGSIQNQEVDICLVPDINTFVIFPWRPREGAVARFICDIYNLDGTPFQGCSRNVLKRVLAQAKSDGFEVGVSPETEFFLFHNDENGNPTTIVHDKAGYGDLTPLDLGENARRDMVLTLEGMGLKISSSHHEWGPGQHEIVLKPADALRAADNIATFKFVVRTIAQRHGLHASFMPKPLAEFNGSALHLTKFLYRQEKNILVNEDQSISEQGFAFIKGITKHVAAITAITNPLVNSYKRLYPGDFSPYIVGWSDSNRNTIIRIPGKCREESGIEIRNPDPACNPYLAMGLLLAAGLEGISSKYAPTNEVSEIQLLPQNLKEALVEFEKDSMVRETIGDYIYQKYVTAKEKEWQRFSSQIHPWELTEYLSTY